MCGRVAVGRTEGFRRRGVTEVMSPTQIHCANVNLPKDKEMEAEKHKMCLKWISIFMFYRVHKGTHIAP